jgi:hypothetical protein
MEILLSRSASLRYSLRRPGLRAVSAITYHERDEHKIARRTRTGHRKSVHCAWPTGAILVFLASPRNREKFTKELAHFRWFDVRFASAVPWKVDPKLKLWDRHVQGIDNVSRLLKSKGAGQTCWIISEDSSLDAQELQLEPALESAIGSRMGAILSCMPGKLAYYVGEEESLLLAR